MNGSRMHLHRSSILILIVGLLLTTAVAVSSILTINNNESERLSAQVRQISTSLRAAVPAIQQPLISAVDIAGSTGGVAAFKDFVASNVGDQAPFRSVTLWKIEGGVPRLLATIGPQPALLENRAAASNFIGHVNASSQLTVVGPFHGPVRTLGFAERLPDSTNGLVVYAENSLPAATRTEYESSSPFHGLRFVLYLGRTLTFTQLMETSVDLPVTGRYSTATVPFANSVVTIVALPVGSSSGFSKYAVPWFVGLSGVSLSLIATFTSERRTRRREATEMLAGDIERRYDTQRDISQTLQRALLPQEFAAFAGIEIAVQYLPGAEHLEIGGDWYDAIPVDADHFFFTVGDVTGRGLAAATTMAQLRHAIRAYAVQGDGPASVLEKIDKLVSVERDGRFATVLCGLVNIPGQRVTVASAGHPAPLLIDTDGSRFLASPVGTPIGVRPRSPRRETTFDVTSNAILVTYTDGLVERRGQNLDEGFERLQLAATTNAESVDELLRIVLVEMVPHGSDDDIVVLGIKWLTLDDVEHSASSSDPRLDSLSTTREFAPVVSSIQEARHFVTEILRDVSATKVDDIAVLVSELATNAVLHANSSFVVEVIFLENRSTVRVQVTDRGPGIPIIQSSRSDGPHNRGLQIVEDLSDRWGVDVATDQTSKTVWFEIQSK